MPLVPRSESRSVYALALRLRTLDWSLLAGDANGEPDVGFVILGSGNGFERVLP